MDQKLKVLPYLDPFVLFCLGEWEAEGKEEKNEKRVVLRIKEDMRMGLNRSIGGTRAVVPKLAVVMFGHFIS